MTRENSIRDPPGRRAETENPNPSDGAGGAITVHRGLPLHEPDGTRVAIDCYVPAASGPHPAVLLVHGGGFVSGDRGELARYAVALADEGYLVAATDYRLAPAHPFPAGVIDVRAAIAWLRDGRAPGVAEPTSVAAVGYSAGATLAATAALTADEPAFAPEAFPTTDASVDAFVGIAGIYDLAAWDEPATNRDYLGATPAEAPERVELASPIEQVGIRAPPTLLCHGGADERVPASQSERFGTALEDVTDVTVRVLPEADHHVVHAAAHVGTIEDALLDFLATNR